MVTCCLLLLVYLQMIILYSVKMPAFSFDTVPVFIHTCNVSGPWNSTTLQYFAKYPIITMEKGSGVYATEEPYASQYAEDKIIEACRQIKAIKPDIICIFYYNSLRDWTFYRVHETLAAHNEWWLKDNNGRTVLVGGDKSFPKPAQGLLVPDYRQKVVQKLWSDECVNVARDNYGIVDGCFSDTPQVNTFNGYNFTKQDLKEFEIGHNASIAATQFGLNASNASVTICDNGYVPQGNIATMLQTFDAAEQYIQQLLSFSTRGVLIEVHAHQCTGTAFINTLSAFLIGMNKYSYYGCSNGWQWPDSWNIWHPEYDKPLGQPLGPAIKLNGIYSRSFKSGTNVTFNTKTNTGKIDWASALSLN